MQGTGLTQTNPKQSFLHFLHFLYFQIHQQLRISLRQKELYWHEESKEHNQIHWIVTRVTENSGLGSCLAYVLIFSDPHHVWMSVRTRTKEARIPDKLPKWLQAGWLDLDCPALERCLTVLADCIRPTVRHTRRGTFTLNRRCVLVCLIYIARYIACVYRQVYCLYILSGILPTATCLLAPNRLLKQ